MFALHLTAHQSALCQHSSTSLLCHRGTGTRTSGTGLHTCFTCTHFIACCFGNVLNPTRDQPSPLSTHGSHPKGRDRSLSFAILLPNTLTLQKPQLFSSTLVGNISPCRDAPKVDCGQNCTDSSALGHSKPGSNHLPGTAQELFDITFGAF